MPPKKRKIVQGQTTLFGTVAQAAESSSVPPSVRRRGDVDSWRAFAQSKWKERFPWLELLSDGVYCLYCRKGSVRRAFASGSETFITQPFTGVRPDVLKRHESDSVVHSENAKIYREGIERSRKKKTVTQLVSTQDCLTVDGEAFCDALKCLYWLAKHEIPHTTNFNPLCDLCIDLGNTTLTRLQTAKNRTYGSEQSMHEMLSAISDTLEDTILQEVCASPYYAIIMDQSTNLSTVKQLGVVVQYLSMETATLQCRFLKLLDMSQYVHATAENIVDCLTKYLDTASPSPSSRKLAGASSDGASVMLGEENGVMARLKAKVPGLIVTHCAAHRVALAACDAANAEPWFRKFEKSLNQVYTFFSRSSARTAELKEMQSLLDHPQLKLQRSTDTRWLSLENAVTALRRCFKPVKAVLEHEGAEGEATAIGLSVQLSKPEYIITLYLLSDVLDILSSLSCVCQSVDLNLLGVETLVNDKIAALEKIREDVFMGGFMMDAQTDYPSEMSQINRDTFKVRQRVICQP